MNARDRQFWTEFLQLYRSLPAVWKVKSPEYSSRKLKTAAYEKLAKKLREVEPKADRALVIQKINTFRTNYRRDLRKREQCTDDEPFVSTLWYYDLLGFLEEMYSAPCQSIGSGVIKRSPSESFEQHTESEEFLEEDVLLSYPPAYEVPQQKRRRISPKAETAATAMRTLNQHVTSPNSPASNSSVLHQHEQRLERKARAEYKLHRERQRALADSESLAHSWSTQYNDLTAMQKVLARKLISDVLFYGCMQQLSPSHVPQLQQMMSHRSTSPLIEDVSASPNADGIQYDLDSDMEAD